MEPFPTTPRASQAARAAAVAIGLAAVLLATRVTITSTDWIGRPFPGFMLLENRVVASVGLPGWTGIGVPGLFQSQVVAVDGRPVHSAAEIYDFVASIPVGAPVTYSLLRGGRLDQVTIPTERFERRDWALLFGPFLLNGIMYMASGLVVWLLRPGPIGRAFVALGITWALFLLTAMDLYGPSTFFRFHALGETMLAPTVFQLTMLFPRPHRFERWRLAGYLPALLLLVPYQIFIDRPAVYTAVLKANMGYLGAVSVLLGARFVTAFLLGHSALARQRVRMVTVGSLIGTALPGALVLSSAVLGGAVAMNLGTLTSVLLPLSLAYGIVRHDLFELDAMAKRGAYYILLTGAVGATYVAVVLLFNLALPGEVTGSAAFPVLFTLAVLMLFNPLRTFLQGVVDRLFFRTSYDGAHVLDKVGGELASALTREHIARLVRNGVQGAIPNARTRLFVGNVSQGLEEVGGVITVPDVLVPLLAPGRVLTSFESADAYPSPETSEQVRNVLGALEAEIAVPLWLHGELIGLLTAGAKRSGLFYTAGDAAFLRALAQQAAIALQNAASYEALIELNARLEERVAERTVQLETSNRELSAALENLQRAQVQLVQSEKMASLGRLVAGVAHEINNPVSFIATSVSPLRRRLERAASCAPPETRRLLGEAEEIVDIMARGAERTTAIVQDLRSFSRLGEASRKPADLHEGLDTTLRLLEARWRDRIAVHRNLGDLPPVECDPGQMNQVFMNVLANACDAVGDGGSIWIATRVLDEAVEVAIRDDGPGMPPEVRDHVFDPFFTTKDVGHGTGLGLAISHQVVTGHGGTIEVESAPGAGTTVRIRLPIERAATLDSVASAGG